MRPATKLSPQSRNGGARPLAPHKLLKAKGQERDTAGDTYPTGPHVVSIGHGFLLVQLVDLLQLLPVDMGFHLLVRKATNSLHGRNGFFCRVVGLCQSTLNFLGELLQRAKRGGEAEERSYFPPPNNTLPT